MADESNFFKVTSHHRDLSIKTNANTLELRSNSNTLQSVINIDHPEKLALKNLEYLIAVLLFIPPPKHILLLGTGGGSLVHFLRHHYPDSHLTSVDIDAELLNLMHEKMNNDTPPIISTFCSTALASVSHQNQIPVSTSRAIGAMKVKSMIR